MPAGPFKPAFGARTEHRTLLPKLPESKRYTFTRGQQSLQSSLIPSSRTQDIVGPPQPASWPGSLPEWKIYWAHQKIGRYPEIHFRYQNPALGGRLVLGGLVIDFLEFDLPIALSVQGKYYHYQRGSALQSRDVAQRWLLSNKGLRLIFLDEEDCLKRPIWILKEALRGVDHSRLRRR